MVAAILWVTPPPTGGNNTGGVGRGHQPAIHDHHAKVRSHQGRVRLYQKTVLGPRCLSLEQHLKIGTHTGECGVLS